MAPSPAASRRADQPSLRARLQRWVVLPLAGAVALDGWITFVNGRDTASVVQDRLLLGSARIVAEPLRFEDGSFQYHIPPAALELFQSDHDDRVYYRVTTGSGVLLAGYEDLQAPAVPLLPESPHYFDTRVRGEPVRAVAFLQPVVGTPGGLPVLVVIGQTMRGHAQLTRVLWAHAMGPQLFLLALTAGLIALGLRQGLQPLIRLRDLVLSRRAGTLQPLAMAAMPAELSPLVAAINDYIQRLEAHAGAQRKFVQNAAHQLRTPLAVLNTQAAVAGRSADPVAKDEALAAIRQTLQQAVRLLNQLLTLSAADARAEPRAGGPASAPVNRLDALVQQVLEDLSAQAQAKQIDLGYEQTGAPPQVAGSPVALREILLNLVDNAIRYTPDRGRVTVKLHAQPGQVALRVQDNGPGIAPAHHAQVFERFFRLDNTRSDGCGLGLAIVRELATHLDAQVSLSAPAQGSGLVVTVLFAAPTRADAGAAPQAASQPSTENAGTG